MTQYYETDDNIICLHNRHQYNFVLNINFAFALIFCNCMIIILRRRTIPEYIGHKLSEHNIF